MPTIKHPITPCLWFDTQAEAAAKFYVSIFENSRVKRVSRYGKVLSEMHGKETDTVLTVEFEINGQAFVALNGGPLFKFNEAVSFQVACDSQDEIDYFWNQLSDGGQEGSCGWLKDRYGVSWQIAPSSLPQMLTDADSARSERAMAVLLKMKKFDLATLRRAYAGQ